jgi:CDP-diacylglycerol--glycerol-3-phosphate 3-phosphatidyltransferase
VSFNTPANWLTFARVLALPAIVYLGTFYSPVDHPGYGMAAAIVFTAASLTDILDGWLARRRGEVSEFGKLVDPIADKILIVSAFIMLIDLRRLAPWMVTLIIAREFAVSGLRAHAGSRGLVIPARAAGKLKATLQVLAIIFLFAYRPLLGIPLDRMGMWFFYAAFAATMWSGFEYFRDYLRVLRGHPAP